MKSKLIWMQGMLTLLAALAGCGDSASSTIDDTETTSSGSAGTGGSTAGTGDSTADTEESTAITEDGVAGTLKAPYKWHPGHYVAPVGSMTLDSVLNEIENRPLFRGVQLRYTWRSIEKSKGVYDFSAIHADLDKVQGKHKRLLILLMTKAFGGGKAAPDYLRTPEYEGGVFTYDSPSNSGENIKLYVPAVRNRLIKLVQALGAELDQEPYLDRIQFNETSLGQVSPDLTPAQKTAFFDNLLLVHRATVAAFPTTVVTQFVNFPTAYVLPKIPNDLPLSHVALGGPDVFLDNPSLDNKAYTYYPPLSNVVPLSPSVQNEDYEVPYHGGPVSYQPVPDLYAKAKNELKANYICWDARTWVVPGTSKVPWTEVKKLVDSLPQDDPAGGLNRQRPDALK
ncbi:MAG: hypothetical protein QM820_27135 [Minicystis sp.]